MLSEREAFMGFSYTPGIGVTRIKYLLGEYKTASNAWSASDYKIKQILGQKIYQSLCKNRKHFNPTQELKTLSELNITLVTLNEPFYPPQLYKTPNPPTTLFIKGNPKLLLKPQIAIVGTRKPTPYGISTARKLATDLSKAGKIITSGLALGIDTFAHKAALETGGKTIAVLGCGVDNCYPKSHREVYNRIIEQAAVVSEVPPGTKINRGIFVTRNRIISGLAEAVVVIEGAIRSGTMITARNALEQGRDVYAVPGHISSRMSDGPNYLIKQGAIPVATAKDILDQTG